MISELKWDSSFFGRKIGRLDPVPSGEELGGMLVESLAQGYEYLTCRVFANQIAEVQLLERHGFYLTDAGIIWKRHITATEWSSSLAREGTSKDGETIKKNATGLFREGRFYHDPFFTTEEADRFYRTWAENLLKGLADRVFLIEEAGFVACKILHGRGDIPLIGVAPAHQAKGIGRALMTEALRWFAEEQIAEVTVRTQASNLGAIGFYERLGFTIKETDITMGKIFDGRDRQGA
jgi:ribosomal protein S18 acetylase RimI-like enzyme